MRYYHAPFWSNGPITKFLKLRIGSYEWRVDTYACVHHETISPLLRKYSRRTYKSISAILETPDFYEVFLNGDPELRSVFDPYEQTFEPGSDLERKIKDICAARLAKITTTSDFIENYNFSYDQFCIDDGTRIINHFGYLHYEMNIEVSEALKLAESAIGAKFEDPEWLFKTLPKIKPESLESVLGNVNKKYRAFG